MCGITVTDICYPFSLDDVLDLSSYTDRKNDIIPCLSTPNQHTKNGEKIVEKKNYSPIFLPFNSKTVPIAKRIANIH